MKTSETTEKLINPKKGGAILAAVILCFALSIGAFVVSGVLFSNIEQEIYLSNSLQISNIVAGAMIAIAICFLLLCFLLAVGLKVVTPNEALVLLLFGKYYGTISSDGFWWVNPFCVALNPARDAQLRKITEGKSNKDLEAINIGLYSKRLSLKARTLNNGKQKINDLEGNPIEIGVVVIWKIVNTAKAVFNVENYDMFVSTQADAAIRQVARLYPYDVSNEGDEKSLRGSSQEIAAELKKELQSRVEFAGIEILDSRISHLAYAPEIASAMLQRQQAAAVIAARQKIVEGAVGMVEMALAKLSENNIVKLDDERKAAMVSNLLVVLCGSKDAQPIVNSGSIY